MYFVMFPKSSWRFDSVVPHNQEKGKYTQATLSRLSRLYLHIYSYVKEAMNLVERAHGVGD